MRKYLKKLLFSFVLKIKQLFFERTILRIKKNMKLKYAIKNSLEIVFYLFSSKSQKSVAWNFLARVPIMPFTRY